MEARQVRNPYLQSERDTALVDEVARKYISSYIASEIEQLSKFLVQKSGPELLTLTKALANLTTALTTLKSEIVTGTVKAKSIEAEKFGKVSAESVAVGGGVKSVSCTTRTLNSLSTITDKLVAEAAKVGELTAEVAHIKKIPTVKADEVYANSAVLTYGLVSSSVVSKSVTADSATYTNLHASTLSADCSVFKGVSEFRGETRFSKPIEVEKAIAKRVEATALATSTLTANSANMNNITTTSINGLDFNTLVTAVRVLEGLSPDGLVIGGKVPKSITLEELFDTEIFKDKLSKAVEGFVRSEPVNEVGQKINGALVVGSLNDRVVLGCGNSITASGRCHLSGVVLDNGVVRAKTPTYRSDGELKASGAGTVGVVGGVLKFYSPNGQVVELGGSSSNSNSNTAKTIRKELTPELLKPSGHYVVGSLPINPTSAIIQVRDAGKGCAVVNCEIFCTDESVSIKPLEPVSTAIYVLFLGA